MSLQNLKQWFADMSTGYGDTSLVCRIFYVSRDLCHAPFKIFLCVFRDIATVHLCTKFQVATSTRFGDMVGVRQNLRVT